MRDWKVLVVDDGHGLDIDIINGQADYLEYASQTGDQRAALSVYAQKGTVPGYLDYGVSWADQYSSQNTVAQLSNEVQQQVQQWAGAGEANMNTASLYNAQLIPNGGNVGVIVTRGNA